MRTRRSEVLVALILATFVGGVSEAHGADAFRGHTWGTSLSNVTELEGRPDYRDAAAGVIAYENLSVGPYSVQAYFVFDQDDLLIAGLYRVLENHILQSEKYLRDFRDLDERLTELYGTPDLTVQEWITDSRELSGAAVTAGDVILRTAWQSQRGTIVHQLSKPLPGEFLAQHTIAYSWIGLGSLDELLGRLDTGGL